MGIFNKREKCICQKCDENKNNFQKMLIYRTNMCYHNIY